MGRRSRASARFALRFFVLGTVVLAAEMPVRGQAGSVNPAADQVRPAIEWKRFDYVCAGGVKLTVFLHGQTVKVRSEDHLYLLMQTRSADGTRYSDGRVVWWNRGDSGFLSEDAPSGEGRMIEKDCQRIEPPRVPSKTAVLAGTVGYREKIALPPGAVIEVQLLEITAAEAPPVVIAEERDPLGARQVPVPFELRYDPAAIDAKGRYRVSARILIDGRAQFGTDRPYPIPTGGNPSPLELILKRLPAGP